MKRQAIEERIPYSTDDKITALEKSGYRCAHCGKRIGTGEVTMDHFVPISKGGINRKINIIPLCFDCNSRKRNKVVSPGWYLEYLNEKPKNELTDYFNSYISSFEYLSRKNLFSCDMYQLSIYIGPPIRHARGQKRREIARVMTKKYVLERLYPEEYEEAAQFYIRVLKRYDLLASEDTARKNMEFWNDFGTVYVVRDPLSGDIRLLVPIVMGMDINGDGLLWTHMFSLYPSETTARLVDVIPEFMAGTLAREQHLNSVRLVNNVLPKDPAAAYIRERYTFSRRGMFYQMYSHFRARDTNGAEENGNFIYRDQFKGAKERLRRFFLRDGYDQLDWMAGSVLEECEMDTRKPVYLYPRAENLAASQKTPEVMM